MSRAKEARRAVQESGSPLTSHSLNQFKLKLGDEGLRRLMRELPHPDPADKEAPEPTAEILEELRAKDLPLTAGFLEAILPEMVAIAQRRIADEESKPNLTIPQRRANLLSDVQRIYKLAKAKELHLSMVDFTREGTIFFGIRDANPQDRPIPGQIFLLTFRRMGVFRVDRSTANNLIFQTFCQSLADNLASCDFKLYGQEMVVERVQTCAYLLSNLASLALNGGVHRGQLQEVIFQSMIPYFQNELRKR